MMESQNTASELSSLSPLKQAFLALQRAEARIRELESEAPEPIAIVGMGCRFPGGEGGVEGYWSLLQARRSAIGERVEERFSGLLRGETLPRSARSAALLDRVDLFDPRHFGISPREAAGMDPQQRLLLEVSWEALENAGIDPFSLYQSPTGVYMGIASHDYAQLQLGAGGIERIDAHFASGGAASVAAGRISYVLGLNGPAVSIDTACSSSLVAVHLACAALRQGDCAAALAGGVNLILSPESSIAFAQAGMLSASGEVRAFDALADGFVRGEGCGVVVLKRLSLARAAGDRILGLILGSAVNQDGASSGLTVPNGLAQQALLREAHRRAGIKPWQVGYVEAHGTGTALGDPIEAEALGAVFGGDAGRSGKLFIGSVKSNAGHLESAAGVAGLIKVALGLRHGVIPGQLHWTAPSPHVRWDELGLEVATEERAWEPIGNRRIGGVSSFGFSGTNAHVVLEGWTEPAEAASNLPEELRPEALVVTARSETALRELAARYAEHLETTESGWSAICWTAAVGRAVFGERLVVVASGKSEAVKKLRAWLDGQRASGVYRGQVAVGHRTAATALDGDAGIEEVASGFARGDAVDWAQRFAGRRPGRVELPTYPFQQERYWIEAVPQEAGGSKDSGRPTGRGMLGRRLRTAGVRGQFETLLLESSWIGEHRVDGVAVLPAAGHLELMLEAGAETFGAGCALEDVVLLTPLTVAGERSAQIVVETEGGGRSRVRIFLEEAKGPEGKVGGKSSGGPEGGWQAVSEGWLRPSATERAEPISVYEIRTHLGPSMDGDAVYAQLAARGLGFGERFRGLGRAWAGDGEAMGEIAATVPDPAWQIAPWWLDACLQVAGLAGSGPGVGDGELYLPMGLDRLEVFGQPEGRCWSYVAVRRLDPQTVVADLTVADSEGRILLTCRDLRFRKSQRKTTNLRSLLYRIEWRSCELASRPQSALIHEATAPIELKLRQWSSSDTVAEYNLFSTELEVLSADYVLQAFRELGWPEADRVWSEQGLQYRWKILPRHRRLLHRLLEIAGETGAISRSGDGFRFAPAQSAIATDRVARLRARFPLGSAEIDLAVRCGESLAKALLGKVDGRELLFPNGKSEEMTRIYRDAVPARIYNQMVAGVVSHIAGAGVRGGVRILEVGGGTAATTGYVLEALRSANRTPSEYLFTDISPLLVRRAKDSFGQDEFFHARVFDLEREAVAQGIEGKFSIVVAVNVVHATADLSATIGRLKDLLSPDGALILVEVTGKQRWADITVGLLDGWWSYTDLELRRDYPTLQSGAWQPMLKDAGFGSVVTLPRKSDRQSIFSRQELIVAFEPRQSKRMLIVGDGELAHCTSGQLRRHHVFVDQVNVETLAEKLESSPVFDAVLWIAERRDRLDDPPGASASSAAQDSILSLLSTAQLLAARTEQPTPRLYVVTAGASAISPQERIQLADTSLLGLAAGIASEIPALRCTRIDCGTEENDLDAQCIVAEVLSDDAERWCAWRSGKRYVASLQGVPSDTAKRPQERVQLAAGSGIDALHYAPFAKRLLLADEVEIEVRATALNFRDVLQALGVVNLNSPLGTDCAGVVLRAGVAVVDLVPGDEVVAIAPGCFASHAIASRALVVRKPEKLSFAEAAAQAVAYLTADYCLNELGKVRKGERVLIHAAAGGVGLAAVHLCLKLGAEPVATAGSAKKRAYLGTLGVTHVYDSRSTDFAREISGGVDIVLNSLAGAAIDEGLGLLRTGGRFIELGKTDLRTPGLVEQGFPGVQYLHADLTPLFVARSAWVGERLSELLQEIAEGSLASLPVTVFHASEVKQAFRSMSRAEHIGRIVVVRKQAERFAGAHLITGGLRGIGLKLAEWLVSNGARELILVGRQQPDETARRVIEQLTAQGANVRIAQGDIADPQVAAEAVQLGGKELKGVWHLAGVLQNAALADQSWETMRAVLRPKMDGAWNLHTLTREMRLEHFVLFSSWASIDGSHGQANHTAANAFLDGLAHFRRANGLAALSVNWGAWGETGAAAGDAIHRQLLRSGLETMAPEDALEALRLALTLPDEQVAIAAIRWPRYLEQRQSRTSGSFYASFVGDSERRETASRFNGRSESGEVRHGKPEANSPKRSTIEEINRLPAAARGEAITRTIAVAVREILQLRADEAIDPDLPLGELGMDSLLAIELRNVLSGKFSQQFPATVLFDYPTLRALAAYVEKESSVLNLLKPTSQVDLPPKGLSKPARTASTARESTLSILAAIEEMSDEEVESLG
jgi:acyl transferase domain-containing protein/acyl carrier protein